ncbi:hypothetical protein [Rhizobium leguminosarum]|uniref:hypothetical protein n=1 Tax=Rhizobium leguminosarum TaxID=384 RepID=UPI0014415588|nr:hypothetical protein [Rhizobium leguminosarum]MBY5760692.1 hypothetical protein [Rhizobium leguminosarum]MBY5775545.1 hypothetical protein [Rhizobium leguminosarum]NKL88496.1 hypothetical protein [Rhizobium leguminosarum bv. viciae]
MIFSAGTSTAIKLPRQQNYRLHRSKAFRDGFGGRDNFGSGLARCLAIALKIRAKPADFADKQLFAAISTMWAENTRLGENDCVSRKLTKVTTMS